jgi:hypothetical protein
MRLSFLVSLCAAPALVAWGVEMPTGYFRGTMLGWEGTPTAGVLSATGKNGEISTCHYDTKSFIQLDHWHVKIDKLQKGDLIKILADRKIGEQTCYVLSLEVEDPPKPVPQIPGRRPSQAKAVKPNSIRHGNKNVAGVVTAIAETSVTLRTRDGEQTFELLPDTRYFGNGLKMDRAAVNVNQRLSVETSQGIDGQWEAFQLTWGDLTVR